MPMSPSQSQSVYRQGAEKTARVRVTTGNDFSGFLVTGYLGIVRGIIVRSPNLGQSFVGAFKQLVGGNISQYVEVCEQARHDAYVQMVQHAESMGADGILAMRYDATEFVAGVTEVLCYGTAVHLERVR